MRPRRFGGESPILCIPGPRPGPENMKWFGGFAGQRGNPRSDIAIHMKYNKRTINAMYVYIYIYYT